MQKLRAFCLLSLKHQVQLCPDGKSVLHTESRLTHNDAARVELKGVVGYSKQHHGSLHLQCVQVGRQWVLGTHGINDTIQSGSNALQSSKFSIFPGAGPGR